MHSPVYVTVSARTENGRLFVYLLFFSDIPWEHLYQRPQQLAHRLARRYPVLWIEPATLGHTAHWHADAVADHVHRLTVPQFPHHARSPYLRALSRGASRIRPLRFLLFRIQQHLLRRALHRLGVKPEKMLVLIQNFQYIRLALTLHPSMMLFDYIDDAFGFTAFPPYVRREWEETIRAADVVTVTTTALRNRIVAAVPREVHIVNNAVEVAQFQNAAGERPADLPPPQRPIVLYVGAIAQWMDFPLLHMLCRSLPEVSFVFIGPVHPAVRSDVEAVRAAGNCSFLGTKPYSAVPRYLRHGDVGMIPFVRNTLTSAVNPVKFYEYSAAGIPTVTTFFSDDLLEFGDLIFLARTHEEFTAQVRHTLGLANDGRLKGELRAFALRNDWDVRAAMVAGLIDHHTHPR